MAALLFSLVLLVAATELSYRFGLRLHHTQDERRKAQIGGIQAAILGLLPNPLLTRDQVIQLREHNIVSAEAAAEGRAFAGLGIHPQALATILPSYLWRYRAAGQFQRKPAV